MNNLSRLLYVSTAADAVTDDDLRQILESSRSNNSKAGITGVLCGSGSHFIQVLEGPENDLIQLYSRIIDDPRHYDCVLIGIAPVAERMFQQWAMGYLKSSASEVRFNRTELLGYRMHRYDGDELVRSMQRFLKRLKTA